MSKCTWKDCPFEGTNDQVSKTGEVWARLCDVHNQELEASFVEDVDFPKNMLRCWVLAQGGHKKMAENS